MPGTARYAAWSAAAVLGCTPAPPARPEPASVELELLSGGTSFRESTTATTAVPIVPDDPVDAGAADLPDARARPDVDLSVFAEEAEEVEADAAARCPSLDGPGSSGGGTIDGVGVRSAVSRKRAAIQACYGDFMMRVEPRVVRVRASFVVDRDGTTSRISICLSVDDPTLESCIEEVFRSIEYPRPEGGRARVFYPIDLTP